MTAEHERTAENPARRSVGQAAPRKDSEAKVRGTARYGTDVDRENALHAGVLRSQQPHAEIVSVETEAAEAIDGVEGVIAREELPGGFEDRVRHYGDAIAAIAAETPTAAQAGLDAITYELDPLPSVHDARESVREGAPVVQDEPEFGQPDRHPRAVDDPAIAQNVDDYHSVTVGDVEAGLDAAAHVHEASYRTPRVNHCNLDRHCCLAEWDGDRLTITGTLGNRGHAEKTLERLFGDCTVEIKRPPHSGSSFGGRSLAKLTLEPVAATLARETGRPVRLAFDREAEFTAADSRHETFVEIRTGATAAGDLTTLDVEMVADTGPYPNGVGHVVLTGAMSRPVELYAVDHYRFDGVSAFTNNTPAGEYRGIGVTQMIWALESHLDEMARQMDLDPVAFRRDNWVEEGDEHPLSDGPIADTGPRACLTRGRDRFEEIPSPGSVDEAVVRGRGVAAGGQMTTPAMGPNDDYAEVRLVLSEDGDLVAHTGAIEVGQGAETALAQIASEATGFDVDAVTVEGYDPEAGIDDKYGSIANRTTYLIGRAIQAAAENLIDELRDRAAAQLDVSPTTVTVDDGQVRAPDGTVVPLQSILETTLDVRGRSETDEAPLSFGVHFAQVEVDTETGAFDVTAYVAAHDVGYAINPKLVEGQLEGAVQHGIEFATLSELQLSDGIPENPTLAAYPVSSPAEMPDTLACEIVETNEASGPYGAKGIGTPSVPPVAPAITNAIRDAVGTRFTSAPVRDEDVFFALQEGTA